MRDQPWTASLPRMRRSFGFDELVPHLTAAGIDLTIVVQTVCVPEETPELLALAAKASRVAGVVGWVDLSSPACAEQLTTLSEGPAGDRLVGVRHQVQSEPDPQWLARPEVRRGLEAVASHGLVYDLVVTPDQLPGVLDVVRAIPQLRYVLDHAGKPRIAAGEFDSWRRDLAALAAEPNLAVKLSGLVTEADLTTWTVGDLRPYADAVLELFGAARVMIGSDWPVCLLAASYAEVMASAEALTGSLDPAERADVFGGTAMGWYRIAGPQ